MNKVYITNKDNDKSKKIFDAFKVKYDSMSHDERIEYLKNMGLSFTEKDDKSEKIFDAFKAKYDSMSHDERIEYLERMGIYFVEKDDISTKNNTKKLIRKTNNKK